MRRSPWFPLPGQRSTRGLAVVGTVLCGVLVLCGCGGSSGSGGPAGSAPAGAASPVAAGSGTAAPAAQEPAGSPSASAAARNLQVDDALRQELVTAWVDGHNGPDQAPLSRSDVASTSQGSVYYAQETATGAYWAVAAFDPSERAQAKDRQLNGAEGDPLIAFQDGPWLFTRPDGGQ